MPYYEYRCYNCGAILEISHSVDESYTDCFCPYCKMVSHMEKLISRSSFRLSWHTTAHSGTRTPIKNIGGQLYDENSYNAAKNKGVFNKTKSVAVNRTNKITKKVINKRSGNV